jgi:cysteine-rich repeat protein
MTNFFFRGFLYSFLLFFPFACDDGAKVVDACGDDFLDPGEECDGAALPATCGSLGYYDALGTVTCTTDCRFDASGCGARCGDDAIDPDEGEECDGTNLNSNTCVTLGAAGGTLACGEDCRFDTSLCEALCGNQMVESPETCDDGGTEAGDGCSAVCEVEVGWTCLAGNPSQCSPICGDGRILGGEACDPAAFEGETCELQGYHPGTIACSEQCQFDFSGCVASPAPGGGSPSAAGSPVMPAPSTTPPA